MARGFLVFVLVNLGLILLVNEEWKGPRVAYIDIFAYPFYCVFAADAVVTALRSVKLPIGAFHRPKPSGYSCALRITVARADRLPASTARPTAGTKSQSLHLAPIGNADNKIPGRENRIQPSSPFRGRVASVAGSDFEPQWTSAPFITQHNYDGMNLFFSGNDHRMYGFWYYGIPTLFESNQFSSPFFHLVNARMLNAPGARDLRSYETQSIVNDRIMALLGVRYLLSDKLLPARVPVLSYRLVEGRDLYVYSVPDTNLAGYAVTELRHAASGRQAIGLLADPALDPRTTAVLTTSDDLPALVPVTRSDLVVERGGYRVNADSPGTSLLVLPIEYSHCLRADPDHQSCRHDHACFGPIWPWPAILFTAHIEGTLLLRYGPLSSACRMEDWRDADALHIGGAREWPTP